MINDTQSPLVSCIMLSYKRFDLIYGAIDSVLSQDYPNIELILSDDGSENFPGKELEAYVQSHKRDNIVSVLIRRNETNLGTVRNQNAALSLASGKYVINLPNDDLFYNEHVISALVKEFEATGAQIISCRREYIDRETGKRLMILPDKRLERFIKKATPRQMYNRQAILSVFISGTYLTRETLLKYSAKSGTYRYMEDYPMFLSCSRNGVKIHASEIIAIKYSYGEGISTSSQRGMLLDDQIAAYKNEVIDYMQYLKPSVRMYARFNYERLLLKKRNVSLSDKLILCVMHPVGAFIHLAVILECRTLSRRLAAAKAKN